MKMRRAGAPRAKKKQQATRFIVETRTGRTLSRGVTYELERVRCNKPKCGRCKRGPVHGPYWYAYWTTEGRTRKKYIGKNFREVTTDEVLEQEERQRTGSGATEIPTAATAIPVLGNPEDLELVETDYLRPGSRRGPRRRLEVGGHADWLGLVVRVKELTGRKALVQWRDGTRFGTEWVRVEQLEAR